MLQRPKTNPFVPAPHQLSSVLHGIPAPHGIPAFGERDCQRAGQRTLEENTMIEGYEDVKVMDLSGPDQEDSIPFASLPTSSRTAGHSPGAGISVSISQGDSGAERTKSPIFSC